jgi:hypothetical protein
MKNTRTLSAIAVLLALPAIVQAGWFGDDQPPANGQPLSALVKLVEEAGYKTILEIEFEDGVYEVEALDAKGKEIELKVDPVSGKISVK